MLSEKLKSRRVLSVPLRLGLTSLAEDHPFLEQGSFMPSRLSLEEEEELEIQLHSIMIAVNTIVSGTHTLTQLAHMPTAHPLVEEQRKVELAALQAEVAIFKQEATDLR